MQYKVLLKSINYGASREISKYHLYSVFEMSWPHDDKPLVHEEFNLGTSSQREWYISSVLTGDAYTASYKDLILLYGDNVKDPLNIELFKDHLTLDVGESLKIAGGGTPNIGDIEILRHKKNNLLDGTDNRLGNDFIKKYYPSYYKDDKKKEEKKEDDINYSQIIVDFFGKERVSVNGSSLYIHFPKVEVTNSNGRKHTIYEVYLNVMLNFNDNSEEFSIFDTFSGIIQREFEPALISFYINGSSSQKGCKLKLAQGLRTLVSEEEYNSQYVFSHFQRGHAGWKSCCLGEGVLKLYSNRLSTTEEEVIGFCMALENYLSWESLEGGPYITMSQITTSQSNRSYSHNSSYISRDIIRNVTYHEPEGLIQNISNDLSDIAINNDILKKHSPYFSLNNNGNFVDITKADLNVTSDEKYLSKSSLTRRGDNHLMFNGKSIGAMYIDPSLNKKKSERILSGELEQYLHYSVVSEIQNTIKKIIKNDKSKYLEKKPAFVFSEV